MNLVRKGLVNTRGLMPRWTNPNLFGHYKHLTGKYNNGEHAANYYLRPMSAFINRSAINTKSGGLLVNDRQKFPRHRTILRMKRKGKMANIYKSSWDRTDVDFASF